MMFSPLQLIDPLMQWWHFRRSALATIRLCDNIGFVPALIIDCGANESQETKYWIRHWPSAKIISIEPSPQFNPLGEVIRVALGDESSQMNLHQDGGSTHLTDSPGVSVKVMRFDQLGIDIPSKAMLKVDCEQFTYKVLLGAGDQLKRFDLVHVEMWNHLEVEHFVNAQSEIHKLMLAAGFDRCKVVNAVCWLRNVDYTDVVFWKS